MHLGQFEKGKTLTQTYNIYRLSIMNLNFPYSINFVVHHFMFIAFISCLSVRFLQVTLGFIFPYRHQKVPTGCYWFLQIAPPSLMGYIARKANVVIRCPKVKQNMRINMVLMIFDNIVWFKRNLKK